MSVNMPIKQKPDKKLLILDIDETLLHASYQPLQTAKDSTPAYDFMLAEYFVYLRPHLNEFLAFCFEHFHVAIWTSASELYALEVQHKIITDNPRFADKKLAFVWSRKRCVQRLDYEYKDYYFIKDLKKVKKQGYSLEHIIMVDNTPRKLCRNYGNLVCVKDFLGDKNDDELLKLMRYLIKLKTVDNIRQIEKRGWRQAYQDVH